MVFMQARTLACGASSPANSLVCGCVGPVGVTPLGLGPGAGGDVEAMLRLGSKLELGLELRLGSSYMI